MYRAVSVTLIITLLLAFSPSVFANTSDEIIQGRVEAGLFLSPRLGDTNITVAVSDGNVELSGNLGSSEQRDLVVAIVEGIPGVSSVTEDLTLESENNNQEGAADPLAEAYLRWQEAHIRAELLEEFDNSPAMEEFDIEFSFEGDRLTLTGTVGSDIERTIATQLSQRLDAIQVVNNQLEITEETDPLEAEPEFDSEGFDQEFDSDMDVSPEFDDGT